MMSLAGFFDALLAGCIPVVFAPLSAHAQWPWHLGLEKTFSVAVFIPAHRLLGPKPFNVVEYLIDLHYNAQDDVYLRQRAIERVAFSLQYSLPFSDDIANAEKGGGGAPAGGSGGHCGEDRGDDALEISLRNVLRMHEEYRRCYHSPAPISLVDSYQQPHPQDKTARSDDEAQLCEHRVVYGDHIDRSLAPPLLSFSYNINPALL
jgi:hypothetical protein